MENKADEIKGMIPNIDVVNVATDIPTCMLYARHDMKR